MKPKKLLALALACMMSMCTVLPSFATTVDAAPVVTTGLYPSNMTYTISSSTTSTSSTATKTASSKASSTKKVTKTTTKISSSHNNVGTTGLRYWKKVVKVTKKVTSYTKGKKKYTVKTTVTTTTTKKRNKQGIIDMNGYSKVPTWLVNEFYEDEYMAVSTNDLSVLGLFSSSTKRMSIRIDTGDDTDFTICHEFGHYVDKLAGNMSSTSGFQSAYSAEKGSYTHDDYSTGDAAEYFASCYALYQLDKSSFKSTFPKSYAYIVKAVSAAKTAAKND